MNEILIELKKQTEILERIERNDHVGGSVSLESEAEKQHIVQQHMKKTLQKKKPTMEARTEFTFNSDGSIGVETFSPVQGSVIPRPRPNTFETELSSQKSETPVAEPEQNDPPVHPGSAGFAYWHPDVKVCAIGPRYDTGKIGIRFRRSDGTDFGLALSTENAAWLCEHLTSNLLMLLMHKSPFVNVVRDTENGSVSDSFAGRQDDGI